jgi:LysM repeat protein
VSPGSRSSLARFGAPAAFLLAATIAILLVRSATSQSDASTPPRANVPRTTSTAATPPPPPTTARGATVPADAEFYEIESGDTLAVVADRFDTTVERLLVLNPDVDPVALRVGQRIRVK